jgi:hypothetical protein
MKETMATSPPSASNTAAKAAKYREMAKDKSLPQDVRNTYLDKANELEQASYKPSMAKGGMVKTPAKAAAKGMSKSPSIVIAVGVGKPSKKPMMNKGGSVKGKC